MVQRVLYSMSGLDSSFLWPQSWTDQGNREIDGKLLLLHDVLPTYETCAGSYSPFSGVPYVESKQTCSARHCRHQEHRHTESTVHSHKYCLPCNSHITLLQLYSALNGQAVFPCIKKHSDKINYLDQFCNEAADDDDLMWSR